MIVHIEDPRDSMDKLLKLVRVHQGCWIQAQHTKISGYFNHSYLENVIEKNCHSQ